MSDAAVVAIGRHQVVAQDEEPERAGRQAVSGSRVSPAVTLAEVENPHGWSPLGFRNQRPQDTEELLVRERLIEKGRNFYCRIWKHLVVARDHDDADAPLIQSEYQVPREFAFP